MTLKEKYKTVVRPALTEKLGQKNPMALPKITSVTVAVGLSHGLKDPKFTENAESVVTRITGQKPVKTKAKVSISNFKIREGMVVGLRVTLRGERMWSFLDKLVNVTFPRVRDFRGISIKHLDKNGNMSIGFREFLPFPEIRPEEIERVHGLQVTMATTAKNKKAGEALFRSLGFPFKD